MKIIEIPSSRLDEYARIPIFFQVKSIFEILLINNGLGGIKLKERNVATYEKDYDSYGSPLSWSVEFDLHNWGIFLGIENGKAVGGAAVARDTNGLHMLEGRKDMTVLWDLRVLPEMRRMGIGRKLFEFAVGWSKSKGCTQMKIETQNINVNACRFYAAMGAKLGDIRRFAYQEQATVSHEVQLNWYINLR